MATLELQEHQELLHKRTLRAVELSHEGLSFYVFGTIGDLFEKLGTNGYFRVETINKRTLAINKDFVNIIREINVLEVCCTRVRWNNNFPSHDTDFRDGMAFVEYFNIGEISDLPIAISGTRSASDIHVIGNTSNIKSIYKTPYFMYDF